MTHKPTQPYNGLCLVLDKPSRFDIDAHKLFSGWTGQWFFQTALGYYVNQQACYQTTADEFSFDLIPQGTKVVFLLGQAAFSLLRPGQSIMPHRGSPILVDSDKQIYAVASFPPQDACDRFLHKDEDDLDDNEVSDTDTEQETEKEYQKTRQKNWKFWLWHDCRKVIYLLKNNKPRSYPEFKYISFPQASFICSFLASVKDSELTVDIETQPPDQRLLCLSVKAKDNPLIVSIPWRHYSTSENNDNYAYTTSEQGQILKALAQAFHSNVIIGHNLSFDLFILAWIYHIPWPRRVYDTMFAMHRCYPEVEKSLGHVISLVTDLPYHKDESVFSHKTLAQEEQLIKYNAKDVYTTAIIADELRSLAKRLGAEGSIQQANESMGWSLTATLQGMRLDMQKLQVSQHKYDVKFAQYGRLLNTVVGFPLNVRSPKQVSHYLYDTCYLPKPSKDFTKEINLLKLYLKCSLPSIRLMLATREQGKLGSSIKFGLWKGDRVTNSNKITGTDTFRIASTALLKFKSSFNGFGTNSQNWSKKNRINVIPDAGKTLIQVDQSGAEAKVVAYLCIPGFYRELFLNGIKPHVFMAMHLFSSVFASMMGLPNINEYLQAKPAALAKLPRWKELESYIKASDDNANPRERYYFIGKTIIHASSYNMKAPTFQLQTLLKSEGTLVLTLQECKHFLGMFHSLFPEIHRWHDETVDEAKKNGRILRNLFGYPRQFGGSLDDQTFKKMYAFKPQSTVGCITNIALTHVQQRIENGEALFKGVDVLQNGHDSGLFQCPTSQALDVAAAIKKEFEQRLVSPRGEVFYMGADAQIGMNWGGFSEDRNPEGMKTVKFN